MNGSGKMAALGVAGRSRLLGPIIRAATGRSLIRPRARFSVPNHNSAFARSNTSSVIEASASRFLRREMSTHHPFHSAIAAACLVSKLPSDVTASYEDVCNFFGYGYHHSAVPQGGSFRIF